MRAAQTYRGARRNLYFNHWTRLIGGIRSRLMFGDPSPYHLHRNQRRRQLAQDLTWFTADQIRPRSLNSILTGPKSWDRRSQRPGALKPHAPPHPRAA